MGLGGVACPKPLSRKLLKGRKVRQEESVKRETRGQCVERDGYCRLFTYREDVYRLVGSCEGPSQWAHLGEKRRFKTRGMPPEVRHTTADSLMFCQRHHDAYDDRLFGVEPLTADGADGQLRVRSGDREVTV